MIKLNKKIIIKIISTLLVILWMAVVFMLSNQVADESAQTSSGFIEWIVRIVYKDITYENMEIIIESVDTIVRKIAHFVLYAIGGFLISNLIEKYIEDKRKQCILSGVLGISYAITDEIHQYFVPGRSGELRDVCIDSGGIIVGILVWVLLGKIIHKIGGKK